jgi:hypothetical protein
MEDANLEQNLQMCKFAEARGTYPSQRGTDAANLSLYLGLPQGAHLSPRHQALEKRQKSQAEALRFGQHSISDMLYILVQVLFYGLSRSCKGIVQRCPFKNQKEKWPGLQFTRTDYLSILLTPLRIRWTIPLISVSMANYILLKKEELNIRLLSESSLLISVEQISIFLYILGAKEL